MRRGMIALGAALVLSLAPMLPTSAQTSCSFVENFAEFVADIGRAGVGECIEDQWIATAPEEISMAPGQVTSVQPGFIVQRTTNGILLWTSTGGFYFARDGKHWVKEIGQIARPLTAPSSAPTAAPVVPATGLTPELAARCSAVAYVSTSELGPYLGANPGDASRFMMGLDELCRRYADAYGARGVDCFEPAAAEMVARTKRGQQGAMDLFRGRMTACVSVLP